MCFKVYDVNLMTIPIQKGLQQGETADIRRILNKSKNYENAKFYFSYFQPNGKGELRMDDGPVFTPNDLYEFN